MVPGPVDFGDGGRARPGDRMVASQHDGERARLGDLEDLAIDERVRTLDPGGHDIRIAGVDDREHIERLDAELERVDRTGRVLGLADRAGSEPGARAVAHRVVERGADDGHVDASPAELVRLRDPWEVHERRWADVGRQVEVVEDLVLTVPAVVRGKALLGRGLGGALSHGVLRRWAAEGRLPSRSGAAGSHVTSSGARRSGWYRAGRPGLAAVRRVGDHPFGRCAFSAMRIPGITQWRLEPSSLNRCREVASREEVTSRRRQLPRNSAQAASTRAGSAKSS